MKLEILNPLKKIEIEKYIKNIFHVAKLSYWSSWNYVVLNLISCQENIND